MPVSTVYILNRNSTLVDKTYTYGENGLNKSYISI